MSTQIKPIKVWGQGGPNPPKVAIILEELGLPHDIVPWPISDVKKPEYLAINPNGRLPSIEDPNTGITLWESGAILEYLVETYDKDHKLSFVPGTPEVWHARQWLFFQATGQAPYYGQAAWFTKFHHEQIPSAKERYNNEIKRVSSVLEGRLSKQQQESASKDGPWLVGDKISYVDLAFVSWQTVIKFIISKDSYDEAEYPLLHEWIEKMSSRETVKRVMAAAFAQSG